MTHLFARPTVLESVDSTNRYLADRARAGADEGSVVIADRQTAGRGRQGRSWYAEPGTALLCSMLFRPDLEIGSAHLVPTAVGLGARAAIASLAGIEPEMKWPNDLLVGGRKVAGLLSEIVTLPGGYALVVGIGINLVWPTGAPVVPDDPEGADLAASATTLFDACGRRIDRDLLARAMFDEVEDLYALLGRPDGARLLLDRYRDACSTIGRRVRVETRAETFEADAVGIDDGGRLLVRADGTERALEAADVIHLRLATD